MNDTKRSEPKLIDDNYCFGCGQNNPFGLKLKFAWDEESGDYMTTFTPAREHQGWAGRIHGGLVAVAFDEVLSRVVLMKRGMRWVTAELTTRIIRPIAIGETIEIRGRITLERSRLTISEGEAHSLRDGALVASARCKTMPVPPDQLEFWQRAGGAL